MRRAIFGAVSLVLLAFPLCYGSPQQQSVAEAARIAREQKKNQQKPAKIFTNDDLAAKSDGVSVVGSAAAPASKEESAAKPGATQGKTGATEEKAAKPKEEKGQAYWRGRFAEARSKLRDAEKELDILQRELNLQQMQYYSDPNKALREQFERKDINDLRRKIDDKRKEVEQLRQALSDLEDELRQAGGEPGWAREP